MLSWEINSIQRAQRRAGSFEHYLHSFLPIGRCMHLSGTSDSLNENKPISWGRSTGLMLAVAHFWHTIPPHLFTVFYLKLGVLFTAGATVAVLWVGFVLKKGAEMSGWQGERRVECKSWEKKEIRRELVRAERRELIVECFGLYMNEDEDDTEQEKRIAMLCLVVLRILYVALVKGR